MNHDYRRGLVIFLVAGSTWAAGVSPALAQSGPSDNGSTAETVYTEPTPKSTAPLVPSEQQVLPDSDESAPPAEGESPAPETGTAPKGEDDAAPAPAGAGGGGGGDDAPATTRETGADAAPAEAGALPFTGGMALPIAGAGLLLLLGGALLRRRTLV